MTELNFSIYEDPASDRSVVYVNGELHTVGNHIEWLEWLAEYFRGWTIGQITINRIFRHPYFHEHYERDDFPQHESEIRAEDLDDDDKAIQL
jgi:hypothetical protein